MKGNAGGSFHQEVPWERGPIASLIWLSHRRQPTRTKMSLFKVWGRSKPGKGRFERCSAGASNSYMATTACGPPHGIQGLECLLLALSCLFFFLPHPSAPHGLGNVELCAVCPQCYAPSSALWALNMACPVLHVRLSFPLDSSMTPGIGLNTQKVLNKYSLTYAFSGKRRLCSSPQQPS